MPSGKTPARRSLASVTIPLEAVQQRILLSRGHKVMLDTDLAELYEVETKRLVEAVKRNIDRFPDDFMFQLSANEFAILKSQSATSSGWGGRRYPPHAFTEQGVAMLSSVLRSPRAAAVNAAIMRTFVQVREMLASHTELARKVKELEQRMAKTDAKRDVQISSILDAIRQLMAPPPKKDRPLGFTAPDNAES